MKRKPLFLGLCLILLASQGVQFSKSAVIIVYSTDFNVEVSSGLGLGFQGDNSLSIMVTSGLLNATSAFINVNSRKGLFTFTPLDSCDIRVSSPDAQEGFDISIIGASQVSSGGQFIFDAVINTGGEVTIQWGWRIESWIDRYTMLALGMSGLLMMVASPSWVAWQIRKGGIKAQDFESMMYGLIIFVVGFGLLVMWLWG